MEKLSIKQYKAKDGVFAVEEVLNIAITQDSTHKVELMKGDNITLKFNLAQPIFIERGMFIEWDNVKYFVNNVFKPTYNASSGAYQYSVQFDAWYYFWNRYLLVLNPEKGANETSFTYTSVLPEMFKIVYDNIVMYSKGNPSKGIVADETMILPEPCCVVHYDDGGVDVYGYDSVGAWARLDSAVDPSVVPNTEKYVKDKAYLFTYDAVHITDALTTIANAAECEWWMEDNAIHFGRCIHGTMKKPEWNLGEQYENVTRNQSSSQHATRVYSYGSTTNIPARYRKELIFTPTKCEDGNAKIESEYDVKGQTITVGGASRYFRNLNAYQDGKYTNDDLATQKCDYTEIYKEFSFFSESSVSQTSGFTITIMARETVCAFGYLKVEVLDNGSTIFTKEIDNGSYIPSAKDYTFDVPAKTSGFGSSSEYLIYIEARCHIFGSMSVEIDSEANLYYKEDKIYEVANGVKDCFKVVLSDMSYKSAETSNSAFRFKDEVRPLEKMEYFNSSAILSSQSKDLKLYVSGHANLDKTKNEDNYLLGKYNFAKPTRIHFTGVVEIEVENVHAGSTISLSLLPECTNREEESQALGTIAGWTYIHEEGKFKHTEEIDMVLNVPTSGTMTISARVVCTTNTDEAKAYISYYNKDGNIKMLTENRSAKATVIFNKDGATQYAGGKTEYEVLINPVNAEETTENCSWLFSADNADNANLRSLVSNNVPFRFKDGDINEYLVPVSYFTDNYKTRTTIADYKRSLMLPTPESIVGTKEETILEENGFVLTDRNCIEVKGVHPSCTVEAQVKYDDVYPKQIITLGEIEQFTENEELKDEAGQPYWQKLYRYRFYISEKDFPFRQSYIKAGETLSAVFQTGLLAGQEFEIKFEGDCLDDKHSGYKSYVLAYNEEGGIKVPNDILRPNKGDKIVFLHYDISAFQNLGAVLTAEKELLIETVKYLRKAQDENSNYSATLMSGYAKELSNKTYSSLTLRLGDVVKLSNVGFFDGQKECRVQSIELKLDVPWYGAKIALGDATNYSRLSAIEGTQQMSAGYGISTKREGTGNGNGNYLSRVADDSAEGNITFNGNVTTNKKLNANELQAKKIHSTGDVTLDGSIGSAAFGKGLLGHGWQITNDGKAYMESLELRSKLVVPSIEYSRITVNAGNRWQVVGCGEIEKVIPDVKEGKIQNTGQIFLNLKDGELGSLSLYDKCQGIFHRKSNASTFKEENSLNAVAIAASGKISIKKDDIVISYDAGAEGIVFRAKRDFETKVIGINEAKKFNIVYIGGYLGLSHKYAVCPYYNKLDQEIVIDSPTMNCSLTQSYDEGVGKYMYELPENCYAIELPIPKDIWERVGDREVNATEDKDFRNTNFTFAGFTSIYFIITEVCADQENRGHLKYQLRCDDEEEFMNAEGKYEGRQRVDSVLGAITARGLDSLNDVYQAYERQEITLDEWNIYLYWKGRDLYTDNSHPQEGMSIVAYANHQDADRQQCYYETTRYGKELVNMTDWISRPENTMYVERELANETVPILTWDTHEYKYFQLKGWGIAVGNIYYWGSEERLDRPRTIVSQQLEFSLTKTTPMEVEELIAQAKSEDKEIADEAKKQIEAMGWHPITIYNESYFPSEEYPYLYHRWRIQYDDGNYDEFKLCDIWLQDAWAEAAESLYMLQPHYAAIKRLNEMGFALTDPDTGEELPLFCTNESGEATKFDVLSSIALQCDRYFGNTLTERGYLTYSIDNDEEEFDYDESGTHNDKVDNRGVYIDWNTIKVTFSWWSDKTKKKLWRRVSVPVVDDGYTFDVLTNQQMQDVPKDETVLLRAELRFGTLDITHFYDDSCFTWYRASGQNRTQIESDRQWAIDNADRLHSKTLEVGDEDMFKRAYFGCLFDDGLEENKL